MFYKIFNSNRGLSISRLVAALIATIVANGSIIFVVLPHVILLPDAS